MYFEGKIGTEIPLYVLDAKMKHVGENDLSELDPFGIVVKYFISEHSEELSFSVDCQFTDCSVCPYSQLHPAGCKNLVVEYVEENFPEINV